MKHHVTLHFRIEAAAIDEIANAPKDITGGGPPRSYWLCGAQYVLNRLHHAIAFREFSL